MKQLLFGILATLFLFVGSPLLAQDPAGGENQPNVGESCTGVKKQRRGVCKKSAETCTEVHRLDALNLIKICAQLAQNCDVLGVREDEVCRPGGNGRITLNP